MALAIIVGIPTVATQRAAAQSSVTCNSTVVAEGAQCASYGACDDPAERDSWIRGEGAPWITVRIKFIVFKKFHGVDPIPQEDLAAQVDTLNQHFQDYRIRFEKQADEYELNADYYDFCRSAEGSCFRIDEDLCAGLCVDNQQQPALCEAERMKTDYPFDPETQLRVYVVNPNPLDPLPNYDGGLARLPWCPEATDDHGGIILEGDSNYFGGGVLTHEVGHILGLYHTHRGVDPGEVGTEGCEAPCYEPAACDGTCSDPDCDLVGDLCCDTPATGLTTGCASEAGDDDCVDPPVERNSSEVDNFMGYSNDGCWDHFTERQAARMRCWACDKLQGWIIGPDCNDNDNKDVCDILSGSSTDCDGNEVPDDCQSFAIGACCINGGSGQPAVCHGSVREPCCEDMGGTFQGSGSKCSLIDCNSAPNSPGGGS